MGFGLVLVASTDYCSNDQKVVHCATVPVSCGSPIICPPYFPAGVQPVNHHPRDNANMFVQGLLYVFFSLLLLFPGELPCVCFFLYMPRFFSFSCFTYIRTHTLKDSRIQDFFFCSLRPLFRVTQRDIHSAPLLYRTHSPRRIERNGAHTSESAHRAVCVL